MKKITLLLFSFSLLLAQERAMIQFDGVLITQENKDILIKRDIPKTCKNVHIQPQIIYGGNLAASNVADECKKTVVTTVGKIRPMVIAKGVVTVGEIEVLEFLEKMAENPQKYILVDSRTSDWFEVATLPGAINIAYNEMHFDEDFPEDWERFLKLLNIKEKGKTLDFSQAKTALIFCNASWCAQSPRAIKSLIKLGYPTEKLLWYRGGIQDWSLAGFSIIKPK